MEFLFHLMTIILSIMLIGSSIIASSNYKHIEIHAISSSSSFMSATSHEIFAKILVDYAIQALQDEDRNRSIKYLIAANQELTNSSESRNPTYDVEPMSIVEYLVQLMQNSINSTSEGIDGITNNKALVYLNLVDSQLSDKLNEVTAANSTLAKHSLASYANHRYGIRVLYPYYWSIDGTSYLTGRIGTQIVSFFSAKR